MLVEAKACTTSGCGTVVYDRTITYDSYGRPVGSSLAANGASHAYATAYNTNGRAATVAYPSGLTLAYTYDAVGYPAQIKDNASGQAYWTVNSANADLSLTQQTYGNGVSQTNTFSPATGAVATIRAGTSDGVAAFDYTFDTLGNITYRADGRTGTFEYACYDSLNRLTNYAAGAGISSCTASGNKSVQYDAIGNIASKSDVGTYSYPAAAAARPHALAAVTGTVNGVANPAYTYDANGNMTAGAGRTVSYTSFNMAASVTTGTTSASFAYDSEHTRISQTLTVGSNAATTTYLNDPVSGAMSEKAVSGSTTVWRDYILAGGRIVAQKTTTVGGATNTRYILADHLGSTAVVMDESGAVVERDAYDAWGKRRNINGNDDPSCSITSLTSRGFTGHEHIDAECLINMNARIYDPALGRFMTADNIVPDRNNGQSFNRYAYVNNGPLSATDPTGHDNLCTSPYCTAASEQQAEDQMRRAMQDALQSGQCVQATSTQVWCPAGYGPPSDGMGLPSSGKSTPSGGDPFVDTGMPDWWQQSQLHDIGNSGGYCCSYPSSTGTSGGSVQPRTNVPVTNGATQNTKTDQGCYGGEGNSESTGVISFALTNAAIETPHLVGAGLAIYRGARVGAVLGEMFGPEAVPVGLLIGGAVGVGVYYYDKTHNGAISRVVNKYTGQCTASGWAGNGK